MKTFTFKLDDGRTRTAQGRDMWSAWKSLGYCRVLFVTMVASWSQE